MKEISNNKISRAHGYITEKITCNHSSMDVSKYGVLKCNFCNEIVTNYNGSLESETQKRIRIDVFNDFKD